MITGIATCHMHRARVKGRKFFHRRCMSWSYRKRGYDARTHRKEMVRSRDLSTKLAVYSSGMNGLWNAPRNRVVVKMFIIMILAYSARKKRANGPPAYSTLNPDTSSDSPSVKSNGARLVSARVEINHIMASGHDGKMSQVCSCVVIRVDSEKDPLNSKTDSRMIARVTSYEMVCATARRAPIRAYLEFEAQPDHKMEYTARLDMASMNRTPRLRLISGCGMGRGVHIVRARVRAKTGAIINIEIDDVRGRRGSLVNSLTASAIGWRSP